MTDHGLAAPFSLDVTTLFVVAIGVTALLGIFLLFAWTQDRIRALAWWGAAYLIGGLSAGLWLVGQHAVPLMPAIAASRLGRVEARLGKVTAGVTRLRRVVSDLERMGFRQELPSCLAALAEAQKAG